VLIVSPADFHAATKLPVAPPITGGGDPARRIGFAVPASGIKTTGIVRCDEFHVLDPQARDGRKVDALLAAIWETRSRSSRRFSRDGPANVRRPVNEGAKRVLTMSSS
jgi:mRNA interferase ChpB